MKFAIDACVPAPLADALRALGADVVSTAGPAMPDAEVLDGAVAIDRVLITSDKDFGELVFKARHAAVGVVLIRFDVVSGMMAAETAARIAALAEFGRGMFVTLERAQVRTRMLPGA